MADIFDTVEETDVFDKASNNMRIFDPTVEQELTPVYDELRSAAIQGGQFGSPSLAAQAADILPGGDTDQVEKGKERYAQARNGFAKSFDLTTEEADDYLKHRFDLQTEPVSADTFGQVHIKNEVLNQDIPSIEKAVKSSNIPNKEKIVEELPQRLSAFKAGTVDNVAKNHPELTASLGLTGDVNSDFTKISSALNNTATQQFGGGAAAGGLRSLNDLANLASADFAPDGYGSSTAGTPARDLQDSQKIQESLNSLSSEFNKSKTQILGTDAATLGQGAYSVAESVALGAATGGFGELLVPANFLKAAPTIAKFSKAALNVAPVAGLYGTRQAADTYEEAIKLGKSPEEAQELAVKAGVIETGVTMLFSGLGGGGLEDLGLRLTSSAVKKTFTDTIKAIGKDVLAENAEELSINALNDLAVTAKLHPEYTVDDFKKSLRDTLLVTTLTTGPASGITEGVNAIQNTSNKTTDELGFIADENAKETVLKTEDERGDVTPPSPSGVVGESAQQKVDENQQPKITIPSSENAATNGEIRPDSQEAEPGIQSGNIDQRPTSGTEQTLTPEAVTLTTAEEIPAEMTPEIAQIAADNGVVVTEQTTTADVVTSLREVAATPTETTPVPETPSNPENTSLKFAALDADLERLGMPPVASEFTGTDAENWTKATERTNEGPKLVKRILDNPASVESTADKMILLQETARRKQDVATALESVANGEPNAASDLRIAEEAFDEAVTASKAAGSLQGALLRAQRFVTTPDFSLETLRSQVRAKINDGAPLTAAQSKQIEELQTRIRQAEEDVEAKQGEVNELTKALEEKEQISNLESNAKTNDSKAKKKAQVKARIERAKKNLRRKLNQLGAAPDVTIVSDLVAIGYSYIELGIRNFNDFKARLREEYGEKTEKYAQNTYDASVKLYDELNPLVEEDTEPTPKNIRKAAKELVESGVKGTAVLDQVAEQFGLDRDTARDLFLETAVKTRSALQEELSKVRRMESLEREIDRLKSGVVKEPKAKAKKDAEIAAKEKELRDLRKWETLERGVKAANKRISELERRIMEKDFSKPVKVSKTVSNALLDAQAKELEVKAEYQRLFVEDAYKKQSVLTRGYNNVVAPLRAVRSVMASIDLPPMFRQGLNYTLRHPFRSVAATAKGTRAIFSDTAAKRAAQEIKNHPRYEQLVGWGLSLTESGGNVSLKQQEEEFQGDLAKKLFFVRASERGYVTYMNAIRLDAAATMVDSLSPLGGELSKENGKLITNFVNVMTGRGNLGGAEGAATALAGVFFSPRFWASRIQTVTGGFVATGDLLTGFKFGSRDTVAARKLIAGEYARLIVAYGSFVSLLALGAKGYDDEEKFSINFDPTSTDFLKAKIGDTRFDTSGGVSNNLVFFVRVASGQSTDSKGKATELKRSEDYYRAAAKYARGKLAPVPGAFLNWKLEEDVVMNKTTLRSEVVGMILPMSPVDVFEQFDTYGSPGAFGTAALTLLGAGGNTYGDDLAPKQKIAIMLGEEQSAFNRTKSKRPSRTSR